MTQLVLDLEGVGLGLPESKKGGYTCSTRWNTADQEAASGRLIRELRSGAYVINYQYGYLTDTQKDQFITAAEKGWREPILCNFLSPNGSATLQAQFLVTSFTYPKFMWSSTGAIWGDFRIELREVDPHD